ncbi:MAG: NUDIX domain-containing protein [Hyphomicrobiales bacterium]
MLPRALFRLALRLVVQPYFRLTRGQTLGVRAAVRDPSGGFLLVRHTYAPGWMFPGGGVDRSETLEDAVVREVWEETGVRALDRPRLVSVFANFDRFKGDHIALYLIDTWRQEDKTSLEIAEWGFYAPDSLPADTTGGTRRRIAEITNAGSSAVEW